MPFRGWEASKRGYHSLGPRQPCERCKDFGSWGGLPEWPGNAADMRAAFSLVLDVNEKEFLDHPLV
jgi:hypothetical protein